MIESFCKLECLNESAKRFLIGEIGLVAHHRGDENVLKRCELRNEVVALENESHIDSAEAGKLVRLHLCDVLTANENAARVCRVKSRTDV